MGVIGAHIPWVDPNPVGNKYLQLVQGYGYDSAAGHQRCNELFDAEGFDKKARLSCVNPETGNIDHKLMGKWMDAYPKSALV